MMARPLSLDLRTLPLDLKTAGIDVPYGTAWWFLRSESKTFKKLRMATGRP
ncbi:hypothetical protein MUO32_28665 [Shinella sp. CPCC 101442]|uniref:hypothetical protein n=1 Tax=Shinella sp. CPCC 101442 TaxID=2932265 RepID=UPI00215302F6|nr:hypothetical protein [Shinella sp. CPCC 101442]MCR6503003.1 hypothetical protein [Shinella sp. CPCC 101442]